MRFESAFMAIAQNSSADSKPPELPSMVEAKDLPSLTDIPGVESAFSDPLTPIRYLVSAVEQVSISSGRLSFEDAT